MNIKMLRNSQRSKVNGEKPIIECFREEKFSLNYCMSKAMIVAVRCESRRKKVQSYISVVAYANDNDDDE